MQPEIYRKLKDFPWCEISNYGNIRTWRDGRKKRLPYPKPRKWVDHGKGYKNIRFIVNGTHNHRSAHRLVLETFVGPCPDGHAGCHNNGIPSDNRLENLRWDTPKNNNADKIKHGTYRQGEDVESSSLKGLEVQEIKRLLKLGVRQPLLAKMFKTTAPNICLINTGKAWRHIN